MLIDVKCTNCGGVCHADEAERSYTCDFCGSAFLVERGKEFAKVKLDREDDIKNWRDLLENAVRLGQYRDVEKHAERILSVIPRDFSAGYFKAMAVMKLGNPAYFRDFLEKARPEDAEEEELTAVLEDVIVSSELREEAEVKAFVCRMYPDNRQKKYLLKLEKATAEKKKIADQTADIPRDVFICHSSKDAAVAQGACEAIERAGFKCWIAPRNIRPNSTEYVEDIARGVDRCRVLLVISSANAMASRDVQNEIKLAKNKKLVEFKIDSAPHDEFFEYYLGRQQWIDASANPEGYYEVLVNQIKSALSTSAAEQEALREEEKQLRLKALQQAEEAKRLQQETMRRQTELLEKLASGGSGASALTTEKKLENADTFIRLEQYDKAREAYQSVVDETPENYRGWLGLFRVATQNYRLCNKALYGSCCTYLASARRTAKNKQEQEKVEQAIKSYLDNVLGNNQIFEYDVYDYLIKIAPEDYRPYWGVVRLYTGDLKYYEIEPSSDAMKNVKSFYERAVGKALDEKVQASLVKQFGTYLAEIQKVVERKRQAEEERIRKARRGRYVPSVVLVIVGIVWSIVFRTMGGGWWRNWVIAGLMILTIFVAFFLWGTVSDMPNSNAAARLTLLAGLFAIITPIIFACI